MSTSPRAACVCAAQLEAIEVGPQHAVCALALAASKLPLSVMASRY